MTAVAVQRGETRHELPCHAHTVSIQASRLHAALDQD